MGKPRKPSAAAPPEEEEDEDVDLTKIRAGRSEIAGLLRAAAAMERDLAGLDARMAVSVDEVAHASDAVASPLHTQSIAAKAVQSRINRAVSPSLPLLRSFSQVESLQRRLSRLSAAPSGGASPRSRLSRLLKFVDSIDRLQIAVGDVAAGSDPAVERLQEAVEFLGRTKSADQHRIRRLAETLGAVRSLYESEIDSMRYDGLLDDALLRLQEEFESLLLGIRHGGISDDGGGGGGGRGAAARGREGSIAGEESYDGDGGEEDEEEMDGSGDRPAALGSEMETEVLGRIAATLAANDCVDICVDIYVKARYRRAAKALMSLNPDYLKTYAPEDIDGMEWESLEAAIGLWVRHFELAVRTVFVAEKDLCRRVLSSVTIDANTTLWPECFAKIADKIMAVFFRFGEGVARSAREPQKLFKLLDMSEAMEGIRADFAVVFDGEPGRDICGRFRELQKLLVHSSSKVFWEFGQQIEGLQDGVPPPPDGSVPKIVRYAVNYLKFLTSEGYSPAMGRVLRTEHVWKAGILSRPESQETLLGDAVTNILDALHRNIEAKRSRYKDRVLPHIFAMNSYWYIYMRVKGSELAKLVGEEVIRRKYKTAAEEAAYSYQVHAWGPLVDLLERDQEEDLYGGGGGRSTEGREARGALARMKMDAFMEKLHENLRRHGAGGYSIPDADLREQIKEALKKLLVPAYSGFLQANSNVLEGRSVVSPDSVRGMLMKLFDGGGGSGRGGGGPSRSGSVDMGRKSVSTSSELGPAGGAAGNFNRRREFRSRFRPTDHRGSGEL